VQTYPDYPSDAFIVSYDTNGNLRWANHIGGYKADGTDIAVSPGGNIVMASYIGNINGSTSQLTTIATSKPGGKSINLGSGILTSPYNTDLCLTLYDSKGVLKDAQRIGGSGQDGGGSIAFDRNSSLYVAAPYQGDFNVGAFTLNGKGPNNIMVLKFAPNGLLDWVQGDAYGAAGPGASGSLTPSGIALATPFEDGVVDIWVTGSVIGNGILGSINVPDIGAGSPDIFQAMLRSNYTILRDIR